MKMRVVALLHMLYYSVCKGDEFAEYFQRNMRTRQIVGNNHRLHVVFMRKGVRTGKLRFKQ